MRAALIAGASILVPGLALAGEGLVPREKQVVPVLAVRPGKTVPAVVGSAEVRPVPFDPVTGLSARPAPLVADPNALYSNISSFFIFYFTYPGGATSLSGNTVTKLVADDLTLTASPPSPGAKLRYIRFYVHNNDAVSDITARPLVSIYLDKPGAPGSFLASYVVSPVAFGKGGLDLVTVTLAPLFAPIFPGGTKLWLSVTFDDNNGTTGASAAQLNELGLPSMTGPEVGSSTDTVFVTSSAGTFIGVNDPAGSTTNFSGVSGHPPANVAWELATPVELVGFTVE